MGRVFQIMEHLVYGDGVSRMARDFAPLLATLGGEPRIVVVEADERLRSETMPLDPTAFRPDDTAIVHVWGPTRLERFVREFPGRLVLYFQNVTPPEFFPAGSPARDSTAAGLAQLPRLAERASAWVAPSAYSLRDLGARAGCVRPSWVVPPVIEAMDAHGVVADAPTLARLRARGEVNVVFVGRVAPNKAQERVMEVFEHYHVRIDPRSRLHLVGDTADHPEYVARLRALAGRMRSSAAIELTGKVSDEVLAAYYRAADLFLCMSEHEGFGLPPLVAAAHGVPVMARAVAAIPETVGPVGILLHEGDPARIAELAGLVLHDDGLRERLRHAAAAGLRHTSRDAVREAWARVLAA
jgi:glycosyltransferase involved in cell wall biosynthesis